MAGGTIYTGGGGKSFAAIGVNCPAGSTLICTNGTKTLKVENTSGKHIFSIPKAGTWTVSCSVGSLSTSQAVTISESDKGVLKIITLIYSGHYYNRGTFASGISYTPVLTPTTATATAEAAQYTMKSPGKSTFDMYLRLGKVDLTYLNKLLLVYSASCSAGDVDGCIFVSQSEITSYADAAAITTRVDNPSVTEAVIELDVSTLSGQYYIYAGTNSRGGSWQNARTINILEVAYG